MIRAIPLLFASLTVVNCLADIPPGYERVVIDSSATDSNPRMNSRGDIVFSSRAFPKNANVMLYREGLLSSVTDDNVGNGMPSINDSRVIVWCRYSGPDDRYGPTPEIVRLQDGVMEYLTDNDAADYSPRINNAGHVVWFQSMYDGCKDSNRIVQFFDGADVTNLTDGQSDDQPYDLNDNDEIVWTSYDHCVNPWTSQIVYLDARGDLQFVSDDQLEPQTPTINNAGTIAWFYVKDERNELVVLKDGELTDLGPGSTPNVNIHDDIIYTIGGGGTDQIWVYLRSELYHISDGSVWNGQGQINDRTDMCWMMGEYPSYDIVMLKRLPFGDMNCDKRVNFNDIDGFVLALTAGKDEFQKAYPDCDWWLADMNDDRSIDFNDIDPFVDCLINGGCERS